MLYMTVIYLTMEQEMAIMELFTSREWSYLKPDLFKTSAQLGSPCVVNNEGSLRFNVSCTKEHTEDLEVESTNSENEDSEEKQVMMDDTDFVDTSSNIDKPISLMWNEVPEQQTNQQQLDDKSNDRFEKHRLTTVGTSHVKPVTKEPHLTAMIAIEKMNKTENKQTVVHQVSNNVNKKQVNDESNYVGDLHNTEPIPYCDKCGLQFSSRSALNRHLRNKHNASEIPTLKRGRKSSLDKAFTCEFCGRSFKRSCDLKDHILSKHSSTPLPHQCKLCDQSFLRQSFLQSHVNKAHLKKKPYSCDMCKETFYSSQARNLHAARGVCQVNDDSKWQFRCSECSRKFYSAQHRDMHMAAKHVHNVFKCVCGASLLWKSSVSKHKRTCKVYQSNFNDALENQSKSDNATVNQFYPNDATEHQSNHDAMITDSGEKVDESSLSDSASEILIATSVKVSDKSILENDTSRKSEEFFNEMLIPM